jgi:hypothetical protein
LTSGPPSLRRRLSPSSQPAAVHYGMSDDQKALKSSFELAMERLRKQDRDAGVESRPLSDEQKAAIAEVRGFYEAKLAEQDVMHQSQLRRLRDPAERDALEAAYRRDRERLSSERDAKIEKLRRGELP